LASASVGIGICWHLLASCQICSRRWFIYILCSLLSFMEIWRATTSMWHGPQGPVGDPSGTPHGPLISGTLASVHWGPCAIQNWLGAARIYFKVTWYNMI
jgi:hypothetical protein